MSNRCRSSNVIFAAAVCISETSVLSFLNFYSQTRETVHSPALLRICGSHSSPDTQQQLSVHLY